MTAKDHCDRAKFHLTEAHEYQQVELYERANTNALIAIGEALLAGLPSFVTINAESPEVIAKRIANAERKGGYEPLATRLNPDLPKPPPNIDNPKGVA